MRVQGLIYQGICDLALPHVAGKGADLVQSPSGTVASSPISALPVSAHLEEDTSHGNAPNPTVFLPQEQLTWEFAVGSLSLQSLPAGV